MRSDVYFHFQQTAVHCKQKRKINKVHFTNVIPEKSGHTQNSNVLWILCVTRGQLFF
jgi:hypothetical protein